MSSESLIVILFVGLVAGWLAGKVVRGAGFGIIGDIVIGIIGAFIASWLFPEARLSHRQRPRSGNHLFGDRRHHPAVDREAGSDRRPLLTLGIRSGRPGLLPAGFELLASLSMT